MDRSALGFAGAAYILVQIVRAIAAFINGLEGRDDSGEGE
jgi:hypothetical protein